MSFTNQVKEEILKKEYSDNDLLAILLGVFLAKNSFNKNGIKFKTENFEFSNYLINSLKDRFKLHIRFFIKTARNFKEHQEYIFEISNKEKNFFKKLLEYKNENNTNSINEKIVTGYFLACAYIKDPEKAYSVDYFVSTKENGIFLNNILLKLIQKVSITDKKNKTIVYIRSNENILDLLNILGATESFFYYQDIIIQKELKSNIIRSMNYELANETKKVTKIQEIIDMIEYIDSKVGIKSMKPILQEVCKFRMEYQDASLQELASKMHLTKSGLRGRLKQIKDIYDNLREKDNG